MDKCLHARASMSWDSARIASDARTGISASSNGMRVKEAMLSSMSLRMDVAAALQKAFRMLLLMERKSTTPHGWLMDVVPGGTKHKWQ
eukprot:635496-Amphidinium_carterae.1